MAVIIEFVGPPGAGKTTSCQQFSGQLQAKGFRICMVEDIKTYVQNLNSFNKLNLYLKTLFLKNRILLLYILHLNYWRIYSHYAIYRYIRLLIFEQALKKIVRSRGIDVVLLDQWSIQDLWSASIFKRKTYEELSSQLKKFYLMTDYLLYFDIDLKIASERISLRNNRKSRFDSMDANTRLSELIKYNGYLFQLFENSECNKKLILSTDQDPSKNGELLLAQLMHGELKDSKV